MTSTLLETPEAVNKDGQSALSYECGSDQLAILTFDQPSSTANLLDGPTLEALDRFLASLTQRDIRGLILRSAKPSIFIAGADINSVLSNPDPKETDRLISLGQEVFQRLANLPFPTVAAIHGACVGGGYELALACDYRVATPDRCTKIGLPETQLGIIPAWGGTTRLPALIGLPRALDIILGGKTVASPLAKKLGMIDAVVAQEHLLTTARAYIDRGKAARRRKLLVNRFPASHIVRSIAGKQLAKKTRGCYPALPAALDLAVENLGLPESEALANERRTIRSLAATPEARNLIEVFKLRERAKKSARQQAKETPPIVHAAVIGAGVMGAGIAQWCSSRGLDVILTDIDSEQLAKGMAMIEKLYHQARKRHILSDTEARAGYDRVTPFQGDFSLKRCDLVIEAAVEKMEIKKVIFRDLEKRIGPETVLATNTSALSVSELAASTACPDRVLGIHFFNPVHRMPLVELVRGKDTSEETVRRALAFAHEIGKLPVIVRDSPGFIVNRLLMPYMIEAGKLFESGVEVTVIDESMRDFGMPMGPLRLLDEVGLDIAANVAATLQKALGDRLAAPKVIHRMIEKDWLGKKRGRGFYHYTGKKERPANAWQKTKVNITPKAIQERLVALIINEAARCLEEEIVSNPRDIDFAMIMGTGFAPFRGGPLRHADTIGLEAVQRGLEAAQAEPCGLLTEMAAKNQTFYPKQP